MVKAEGLYIEDMTGRRYMDFHGNNVHHLGHGHPHVLGAIKAQLDALSFAPRRFASERAVQLAEALSSRFEDLTGHPGRLLFTTGGSDAVEVALKMALGFWLHRGEDRHRILVLEHGYHGDTIGTMSVGARGAFNRAYEPLLFDVETIPFPGAGAEQATLDALEAACRAGPAALIVEPLIVGAGGMLIYPPWVLAEMRRICARHDVLFIADEVMTGWGRTGTLLACEQADVVPDILCLSKGLTGGAVPLAVTMAREDIYQAHYSDDRAKMFFHSSSYTANPIACAAAAANIAIWEDEPVLARVADLAARQAERLAALEGVRNARVLGTIAAVDLGTEAAAYLSTLGPRLLAFFRERDLLLRPLGNTVYVMPPYCIEDADLDAIYAAIGEAAALA